MSVCSRVFLDVPSDRPSEGEGSLRVPSRPCRDDFGECFRQLLELYNALRTAHQAIAGPRRRLAESASRYAAEGESESESEGSRSRSRSRRARR